MLAGIKYLLDRCRAFQFESIALTAMHRSTWDYEARLRINQNRFLFAYVNEIFDNIDKKKNNKKKKHYTTLTSNFDEIFREIKKDFSFQSINWNIFIIKIFVNVYRVIEILLSRISWKMVKLAAYERVIFSSVQDYTFCE